MCNLERHKAGELVQVLMTCIDSIRNAGKYSRTENASVHAGTAPASGEAQNIGRRFVANKLVG